MFFTFSCKYFWPSVAGVGISWSSLYVTYNRWPVAELVDYGQVSKTADWLRNFYKDACAQRWPLTYCGDWKRSGKYSENKKCEIERAIEWYFELLLIFAWPVRQNLCSFINGNLRRKIGLLKNSMKLMDCSCLPTTTTMFGFCFGLGTLEGSLDSFPLKFESAP